MSDTSTKLTEQRRTSDARYAASIGIDGNELTEATEALWSFVNPASYSREYARGLAAVALRAARALHTEQRVTHALSDSDDDAAGPIGGHCTYCDADVAVEVTTRCALCGTIIQPEESHDDAPTVCTDPCSGDGRMYCGTTDADIDYDETLDAYVHVPSA